MIFVGSISSTQDRRRDLLERLEKQFDLNCQRKFMDEMAEHYSKSRIIFNNAINHDLNMRVFEALCSGSLLVTDSATGSGLDEIFKDKEHLIIYNDANLEDTISQYLQNDEDRDRISRQGRKEVLAHHTYAHRTETMINILNDKISGVDKEKPASMSEKPVAYYENIRNDLIPLIPNDARCILEVGCGTGKTGLALKKINGAFVAGIEMNPAAAKQAKNILDDVIHGDIETIDLPYSDGSFDCIIFADVLEHLVDPLSTLVKVRRLLKAGGTVVTSIPNVQFHSVIHNFIYDRPSSIVDIVVPRKTICKIDEINDTEEKINLISETTPVTTRRAKVKFLIDTGDEIKTTTQNTFVTKNVLDGLENGDLISCILAKSISPKRFGMHFSNFVIVGKTGPKIVFDIKHFVALAAWKKLQKIDDNKLLCRIGSFSEFKKNILNLISQIDFDMLKFIDTDKALNAAIILTVTLGSLVHISSTFSQNLSYFNPHLVYSACFPIASTEVKIINSLILLLLTRSSAIVNIFCISLSGTAKLVLIASDKLGFCSQFSCIYSNTLNVSGDNKGSPPVILNVCKSGYKSGHHSQNASIYGLG